MTDRKSIEMRYEALEARIILTQGPNCDKEDYLIAAFCGVIAGVIDSLFVGKPNLKLTTDNSVLGAQIDKATEAAMEAVAKRSLSHDTDKCNKILKELAGNNLSQKELRKRLKDSFEELGIPDNFSYDLVEKRHGYACEPKYCGLRGNGSLLVYMENKYKVSYDQPTINKLRGNPDIRLSPDNHHMKSLAHWPDFIGLFFSISDQFTGRTTFIENGQILQAIPEHNIPTLRGKTILEKLYYGFVNWFGHLLSDFCGSHSSKGRGDGIPIPFFGIFQSLDFGGFSCNETDVQKELTISEIAVKVFEHGYDSRFALTMSAPVILQDLLTRFIWCIKAHFVHGRVWSQCIPDHKHKDLREMLLLANASLCLVDGVDAVYKSNDNLVELLVHLNILAWAKLIKNSLKEVCIRFDFTYADIKTEYEYIDSLLCKYISDLESIDYDNYIRMTNELTAISADLRHEDWDIAVMKMEQYIRRNNVEISVKSKEEFAYKLKQPKGSVTFKLGR